MTSRHTTPLLTLREEAGGDAASSSLSDTLHRLAFGAIGWPWLLFSLWGGTQASKRRLLERVGLEPDALPNLGSWKADTGFLHRIVDAVEELRPANVVELGAGASTLVCAMALESNGGGRLFSFDQHAGFVGATADWLREEGARAQLKHAPLGTSVPDWPGQWYDLGELPESIDLLIIDGPPWTVHPFVRGAADILFDRLSPGAIVLLDDGARPGERIVAHRWRHRWPDMTFMLHAGSTKGTLIGRKAKRGADVLPFRPKERSPAVGNWRRAAAVAALLAAGWIANDVMGSVSAPAHAANFVDEAEASYTASLTRHRMESQPETTQLDRLEIGRATGIALPALPSEWVLDDVQVYPSDLGIAVALVMRTEDGETLSLFATRAETPAEKLPIVENREGRSVAYWEAGPLAYALTAELEPERVLSLAEALSRS